MSSRPSRRILVIEDYPDSAQVTCIALQNHGHSVEVATTGGEGLEKAHAFKPDVIICDLGLPDTDGLALARVIRADQELKDVWPIALTAYFVPQHAAAAGFDEYVTKPADLKRLALLLEQDPPPRQRLASGGRLGAAAGTLGRNCGGHLGAEAYGLVRCCPAGRESGRDERLRLENLRQRGIDGRVQVGRRGVQHRELRSARPPGEEGRRES